MKKRNGTTLALGLTSLALSIAAIAGASLTKGAMQAKAEDTVFYTLDATTVKGKDNSYAGAEDVTVEGITWNATGNLTTNPWRIGGKSLTKVDRAVYTKTSVDKAVSKIELAVGTSSITVNSLKLEVASDKDFNSKIETVTADFKASSTITFCPKTETEWATGSYYKFLFNVTNSDTKNNKYFQFNKVEIYETVSASTTYNVSYDANGGAGEVSDDTEYTAGQSATVRSGETLSKENYAFAGWNTAEDGSGDAYAPGDSMVVDGNTTLYAQWDRTHYAVTYDPNGGSGEAFVEKVAVADAGSYVAASGSAFTNGSFPFDGWATSASGAVVYAVGDSVPLTKDLTLYAHWEIPAMEKIASNDGLYDGMSVIIGNVDGSRVMGAQNGNNCPEVVATDLVPGAGYASLTLGIEDTAKGVRYTLHNGTGYLYAASSGSNHLKVQTTLDDNGRWEIDLATSTVKATGTYTHNLMRYNSSSKIFSCYTGGQSPIALFAMPQAITDEQVANTFIKKYMHMVSAPVGETGTGKCVSESWYATAKEAFNKLTEDQRLLVTDNAEVYARLQAWAVANGDEMTGDLILASKSAPFRSEAGVSQEKNAAAIALIALAGGASAGALVFFLRKKKQDR